MRKSRTSPSERSRHPAGAQPPQKLLNHCPRETTRACHVLLVSARYCSLAFTPQFSLDDDGCARLLATCRQHLDEHVIGPVSLCNDEGRKKTSRLSIRAQIRDRSMRPQARRNRILTLGIGLFGPTNKTSPSPDARSCGTTERSRPLIHRDVTRQPNFRNRDQFCAKPPDGLPRALHALDTHAKKAEIGTWGATGYSYATPYAVPPVRHSGCPRGAYSRHTDTHTSLLRRGASRARVRANT